jgi:hypothetical protein
MILYIIWALTVLCVLINIVLTWNVVYYVRGYSCGGHYEKSTAKTKLLILLIVAPGTLIIIYLLGRIYG